MLNKLRKSDKMLKCLNCDCNEPVFRLVVTFGRPVPGLSEPPLFYDDSKLNIGAMMSVD